jgi:hypothetical protein
MFNFTIITELRNDFTELYMKNFGRHTLSSILDPLLRSALGLLLLAMLVFSLYVVCA